MRPENEPSGRKRSFIEDARRAQVVQAARETVAAVGHANASLARIAEHAGISKSVISYHFDGKDELLEQVATQFFEQTWEYMEPRIAAAGSAAERVRAWIDAQMSYFAAHRPAFLAMIEIVANHRRADGTRPFAASEQEELEALAEVLADGQSAGEFRDFDTRTYAMIISQAMEGALSRWALDEAVDLSVQSRALRDFVDNAIGR
ncbi:TetR family transcriptional regulator [Haloactinopolyspora alba]|uniref:TetR family transcriptional regulator n=1 Tax=Haloactinopolyspora alba TaxID=648780 RepID=A0A2P8DPS4_9ACTN|nr:TetR family transcriptional regulator [Haloactinopolyspora alba]PSK99203.1 TetR family transcriptional regulator [Haloactinopolyspora alba]